MFIFGMLLIIATLIYLLVTNNTRNALYIFSFTSIAYFVFGYGIPLNELNMLIAQTNMLGMALELITISIILYLILKFEDTVFLKDYNLILRSFFFRFETLTLALYLLGILLSSGNLIIDFLMLIAIVRLFKVDKFISYIVINSVLFTNAIFTYPVENIKLVETTVPSVDLLHTSSLLVAIIIPIFMLMLYLSGFFIRNLEKDISVEFKILGIIAITAIVGLLGASNLSSSQLLIYLPVMSLILLYLNDMNVRKKFSRYSQIPLTLSIVLIISFLATIYISLYSFVLFIICALILNSIILNEQYQVDKDLFDPSQVDNTTVLLSIVFIYVMMVFANFSIYNASDIGVPYISTVLNEVAAHGTNVLTRTYLLFTNSAYFSSVTPSLIGDSVSGSTIAYLVIALPALQIISVPAQILLLASTGYKTKISSEVLLGVIAVGLVILTLVSYAIGV